MEESGRHSLQRKDEDDEHVQACMYCHCQANIQATLKPGFWIPIIRTPHLYREKWVIGTNPTVCVLEVTNAIRLLNKEDHGGKLYELARVNEDGHYVQVRIYSTAQWLYIVEFKFVLDETTSRTRATVCSFSSGLIPVTVPLSFLWSSLFFFIPFYDCGKNKKHINSLRRAMALEVTVSKTGRAC